MRWDIVAAVSKKKKILNTTEQVRDAPQAQGSRVLEVLDPATQFRKAQNIKQVKRTCGCVRGFFRRIVQLGLSDSFCRHRDVVATFCVIYNEHTKQKKQ